MRSSQNPLDSNHDEQLADFTDRVLSGQTKEIEANTDPQLRKLEETILRLNRTLPQTSLDEAAVKQMWVRMNARARRENNRSEDSFWKRWFLPNQVRPQFGMALGSIALIVLLLVVIPSFASDGSSTVGTALTSSQGLAMALLLAGAILLIFWITRRK
jgi:hypothetical protein